MANGYPWEAPMTTQEDINKQGNAIVQGNAQQAQNAVYPVDAYNGIMKAVDPKAVANAQNGYTPPADATQQAGANPAQPVTNVSPNDLAPPPAQQIDQARTTGTVVDPQITKVSQQVANRSAGVGDAQTGNIVEPPTPPVAHQMTEQMSTDAQRLSFDMNKVPNWHDSDAFGMGLLNFGVSLLAGNDIYSSMNAGSQVFQTEYGKEKRTIWAEDLRKKGYDENEIQSWIQSGNNKDLTDPMEKKMKIMQYNLAASNLDRNLYENSPEMRNYNMSRQKWEDQMTVQKMKDEEAQQQAQLAISRAHLGLERERLGMEKQKLAAGAKEMPFGLDTRTLSRVQTAVKPYYDKVMNKTSQYDMAANALQQAKALRAAGGSESQVTALYRTGMEAYARGMKGTMTGGISPKEVAEYGGNPNMLGSMWSSAKTAVGGDVPDYELDRMLAAAQGAKSSEQQTWNDFSQNQFQQLAREIGPERASAAMSLFSQTGTNIGGVDPHYAATGGMDNRGMANPRTVQIQR